MRPSKGTERNRAHFMGKVRLAASARALMKMLFVHSLNLSRGYFAIGGRAQKWIERNADWATRQQRARRIATRRQTLCEIGRESGAAGRASASSSWRAGNALSWVRASELAGRRADAIARARQKLTEIRRACITGGHSRCARSSARAKANSIVPASAHFRASKALDCRSSLPSSCIRIGQQSGCDFANLNSLFTLLIEFSRPAS